MKKTKIILIIILAIIIVGIAVLILNIDNNKNQYELEKIEKYSYFKLYEKEKYGVIDDKGNIIIEPQYEMLNIPNPAKALFVCYYDYNENTGKYKTKIFNDKKEEILTEYEEVLPLLCEDSTSNIPFEKSVLKYKENEKYGLIDFSGKKITQSIFDEIESLKYREGCLKVKQNDLYGIINIKGKEIVKVEYTDVKSDEYYTEQNGYLDAGFITQIKTDDGYRYGYVNKNGKEIVKPEYNQINRATEIEDDKSVYLLFSKNGKYGILKNDKVLINNEYEEIEYINTSKIFIVQKDSKQGVMSLEGKEILKIEFDYILSTGNKITTKRGDSIELYNIQGERLDSKYNNMIETDNENYTIVINDSGKYGVVNQNGQTALNNEYSNLEYAFDNLFIATKDGKVGVVDINKGNVIDYKYDIIEKIKGKNALRARTAKNNTIDIYNSNVLLQASIKDAILFYSFDNYFKIVLEKDMFYFDNNGNTVSNITVLGDSKLYSYKNNNKWGFVDKNGNQVVEAKYDLVTEMNQYGFAGIKQNDKWGVIDENGKVILAPTYKVDNQPEFIGKYCRLNFGYGFEYYTTEVK